MRLREVQPVKVSNRRSVQAARAGKTDGITSSALPRNALLSLVAPAEDQLAESAMLSAFIKDMLAAAAEQCASPAASLWRYEKVENTLRLKALHHLGGGVHEAAPSYRLDETLTTCPIWHELRTRGVPITLTLAEDRCAPFRKLLELAGLRRLVLLPLKDGDATIGMVGIALPESNTAEPEKIGTARLLSQQIVAGWKLADVLDCRLQSVVFEERRRISRDLHDTLAQSFTSILIQIDLLEQVPLKGRRQIVQQIARVRRLAQDGLADVRRAIFGVQPHSLENLYLIEALERLTAEFSGAGNVQAEFSHQGSIANVAKTTRGHLLRIAQESLTNVFKHAGATKVRIELLADDHELRLSICDDGTGFNLSKRGMRGGFGLKGMEERVGLIGGRLSVNSRPGSGTQVQVVVPLGAGPGAAKSGR